MQAPFVDRAHTFERVFDLAAVEVGHDVVARVQQFRLAGRAAGPVPHLLRAVGLVDDVRVLDGVTGEAGAALIVSTRPLRLAPRQARIAGLGFATEREPSRGLGIAEAARLALREADLDLAEIDFRISDAAGEPYAFKELALMLARLLRRKRERFPLWLPSESIGYTGAASALVGLAVAFQAFRRGYAPGPRALVSAAGSTGDRAVAVLCDAPERGSA